MTSSVIRDADGDGRPWSVGALQVPSARAAFSRGMVSRSVRQRRAEHSHVQRGVRDSMMALNLLGGFETVEKDRLDDTFSKQVEANLKQLHGGNNPCSTQDCTDESTTSTTAATTTIHT